MIGSSILALAMLLQIPASVTGPAGTYVVNIPGSPAILQTPTSISFSWKPAGMVRPSVPQPDTTPEHLASLTGAPDNSRVDIHIYSGRIVLIAHNPDGSRLINFGQGWLVLPDSGYIP